MASYLLVMPSMGDGLQPTSERNEIELPALQASSGRQDFLHEVRTPAFLTTFHDSVRKKGQILFHANC